MMNVVSICLWLVAACAVPVVAIMFWYWLRTSFEVFCEICREPKKNFRLLIEFCIYFGVCTGMIVGVLLFITKLYVKCIG